MGPGVLLGSEGLPAGAGEQLVLAVVDVGVFGPDDLPVVGDVDAVYAPPEVVGLDFVVAVCGVEFEASRSLGLFNLFCGRICRCHPLTCQRNTKSSGVIRPMNKLNYLGF
jgi:hypothetical protein